jgi:hypothetical protein
MSHSDIDIPLLRPWHDLAAKKGQEARKQIPTTNFFKKQIVSFTDLYYVKHDFW